MKPRLKVSFSGGRTSGFMATKIKKELSWLFDIEFVFCNTSLEDDRTLVFVDQVDKHFGLNLTWLEAVVHPDEMVDGKIKRIGTTHRIVTFETAKRKGEVFLDVVRKYGISNKVFQPCNRELKLRPMDSYFRDLGWKRYTTAIGIRKDEDRRVAEAAGDLQIWYPLIDTWPADKEDVLSFWEDQPFDLQIEEHEGNCVTCHKKSDRKLFQLIAERPEDFEFRFMLDREFGYAGAPYYDNPPTGAKPRVPFRGGLSTEQLFAKAAAVGVMPGSGMRVIPIGVSNVGSGCTESCEAFDMDEDGGPVDEYELYQDII